jgi:hypothetical protein
MENKEWQNLLLRVKNHNSKIENKNTSFNIGDKIIHEVVEVKGFTVVTKNDNGALNIMVTDDPYKVGDKIVYEITEKNNDDYGVNIISSDELTPTV